MAQLPIVLSPKTPSQETESEVPKCIFDGSKKVCSYPDKFQPNNSLIPKVFIISSTEYEPLVNWFRGIFKKHLRTIQDKEFDVVYFSDTSSSDFCNNVCIPIHEAWFCIAIIKEERLPQYIKRGTKEVISSFIMRFNPNVFFEVGLALARKKDVIIYNGEKQELPTDWGNLAKWVIREQSLVLSSEIEDKLNEIIQQNPFIGHPVKWIE
jgi:hypothetical protein